jgi:hypothetical protein
MVLAGSGFVLKYDPDAAKKLVDAHRSRKKGNSRNPRNARRATEKDKEDEDQDQNSLPNKDTQRTAAEVVAAANRATSVERYGQFGQRGSGN